MDFVRRSNTEKTKGIVRYVAGSSQTK